MFLPSPKTMTADPSTPSIPSPAHVPEHVPDHLVVDFDIYDPAPEAERFHAACVEFQRRTPHPLVWTPRHGGHWIAVRGSDVFELHADHAHFSSRHYFVPAAPGQVPLGAFTLDPPEHGPFRSFLSVGMSPKVVAAKQSFVRQLAADLTLDLAPRRGCEFIAAFGDVLPLTVFLDLVELPLADREPLRRGASRRSTASRPICSRIWPHVAAGRAGTCSAARSMPTSTVVRSPMPKPWARRSTFSAQGSTPCHRCSGS
jgi:cytochrome P450